MIESRSIFTAKFTKKIKKMKFSDIKQYPFSSYQCNVSWDFLKIHLDNWSERLCGGKETKDGLELSPSFQRGYVWTEAQQTAYCENILKGCKSGRDVFFNNPTWMGSYRAKTVCIDGQQRIGAVLAFLDGKIKVFGHYVSEFEDKSRLCSPDFVFHVFKIDNQEELIRFYLSLNTGGSAHTDEDLAPAYEELKQLQKK